LCDWALHHSWCRALRHSPRGSSRHAGRARRFGDTRPVA